MSAVEFAPLIGRYVQAERPATVEEIAAGSPETVWVKGVVTGVVDEPTGVQLCLDRRRSCLVPHDGGAGWRFAVHASSPREEV